MKTGWLKRTAALAMSAFIAVTMVPVSALPVRAEERTERERRVSELGFRTDETDGVFCGTSVGSAVGRACQANVPGRAHIRPIFGLDMRGTG